MSEIVWRAEWRPGRSDEILAARAREVPDVLDRALERLGAAGADRLRSQPVHAVTGNFERGIEYSMHGHAGAREVHIGSKSRHAHLVEHGRPPGKMPSPARIASLLGLDRHAGFKVARAIGRRGTPPNPVLERTRQQMEGVLREVSMDVLREVGDLDRGERR